MDVRRAGQEFVGGRGYLAAASMGLPCRATVEALEQDVRAWQRGERTPPDYGPALERSRELYARLVGVPTSWVATGSQTSVLASLVASALPPGAEVLTVLGEFTSITYPFAVRPDVTVRAVPLEALADEVTSSTTAVAFSVVQSATGDVADVDAVTEAAGRHGALTLADLTQAAGVLPVDASRFDVTVCHAYKWLCAPRGAAFLTVQPSLWDRLRPVQAGWYAGRDVWGSCYGTEPDLADDARRFDVAPTWLAWCGAVPALELLAPLDRRAVWRHAADLGAAALAALGAPERHQAVVTVPDPDGERLAALARAGITASGRAGRLRLAFHLWNDEQDVDAVARTLHPIGAQA